MYFKNFRHLIYISVLDMSHYIDVALLYKLKALRDWQKQHLVLLDSVAAHDLMLQIFIAYVNKEPLYVKHLFISSHSYTAIRQHYKIFLASNLIYLEGDVNDRRIKYIRPTPKFLALVCEYLNQDGAPLISINQQ